MAGKSSRDILTEDLQKMEDGMNVLSVHKADIWQDELIWWICKTMRDVLLHVIGRIERERAKEGKKE